MPKIVGVVERLDQDLYDGYVVDFAPGAIGCPRPIHHAMRFFLQAELRPEVGNMEGAGTLHGDRCYSLIQTVITVACADPVAYEAIFRSGRVALIVGDKQYWTKSLATLREGEVAGEINTERGSTWRYALGRSIAIPGRQPFYWTLSLNDYAVQRLRKMEQARHPKYNAMIRMTMAGLLKRDVRLRKMEQARHPKYNAMIRMTMAGLLKRDAL